MNRRLGSLLLAVCLFGAGPSIAFNPSEVLPDPAQEARARTIGRELRCLVCQNQSIDDSDADLAHDLRKLVRERIVAGDSDEAILRFMQQRYGDFVLLRPPVRPDTYLLWFGPLLLLLLGGLGIFMFFRRSGARPLTPQPLSEAERQRVAILLDRQDK